eukprot:TRINITY_DN20017_c0_g1_i1.p1 TRINITY_DN20017_c0_g1~~TRINITY_DN20017_c0_g1_i1.p1  ORF type:complete len:428 (-),score=68.64 TRINITY_DN20017_c0_g1_i1:186-1469(-)
MEELLTQESDSPAVWCEEEIIPMSHPIDERICTDPYSTPHIPPYEDRMVFLRSHLAHPFRTYFACRIAAFLTCKGMSFPGRWVDFGRIVELRMSHTARWLGIQVASLERNLRSSGFERNGGLQTEEIRQYTFPQATSASQDATKIDSNSSSRSRKSKITSKKIPYQVFLLSPKEFNQSLTWSDVDFCVQCRRSECIIQRDYPLRSSIPVYNSTLGTGELVDKTSEEKTLVLNYGTDAAPSDSPFRYAECFGQLGFPDQSSHIATTQQNQSSSGLFNGSANTICNFSTNHSPAKFRRVDFVGGSDCISFAAIKLGVRVHNDSRTTYAVDCSDEVMSIFSCLESPSLNPDGHHEQSLNPCSQHGDEEVSDTSPVIYEEHTDEQFSQYLLKYVDEMEDDEKCESNTPDEYQFAESKGYSDVKIAADQPPF